jgi:predicted nucleotidyltransferase
MKRADVLRILAEHQEELERLGVLSLAVFGSVARDEAGPDSDLDLLVEIKRPMGLFGFIGIQEHLESLLGTSVDLVTKDALKPRLRDRILREAVAVDMSSRAVP